MNWLDVTPSPDQIAGERRSDRRYRIDLELRWKLIRRKKVRDNGVGRTIDISSGGILFDAMRPLPTGMNVELHVAWPVRLHDVAPLQLVMTGRIVRAEGTRAAVRVTQHEFRTVGVQNEQQPVVKPTKTPGMYSTGGVGNWVKST